MKPVDQTIFGKPGGNCLAACIATILELPLDDGLHRQAARSLEGGDMLMLIARQPTEIRVCEVTIETDGVVRRCFDAGPHLLVHLWEPVDEARERGPILMSTARWSPWSAHIDPELSDG